MNVQYLDLTRVENGEDTAEMVPANYIRGIREIKLDDATLTELTIIATEDRPAVANGAPPPGVVMVRETFYDVPGTKIRVREPITDITKALKKLGLATVIPVAKREKKIDPPAGPTPPAAGGADDGQV